jgi:hypothetical protein
MEPFLAANQRNNPEDERVFFTQDLVAQSDPDWAELDDQTSGASDPLFGGKLAGEYRRLYERIMRLAV